LTAAIPNVVLPGFVVPAARENFFFVSPAGPEASALHAMPRGWRNGGEWMREELLLDVPHR